VENGRRRSVRRVLVDLAGMEMTMEIVQGERVSRRMMKRKRRKRGKKN